MTLAACEMTPADAALSRSTAGLASLHEAAAHARHGGDWTGAACAYRAILAADPSEVALQVQLGHALKESGDFDGAEYAYRTYLAAAADDPDIRLQLGHLERVRGNFEQARAWYENAVGLAAEASPVSVEARRGLEAVEHAGLDERRRDALALTDAGRFAEARVLLESLVDGDGQEELSGILGNTAKELGDLDAAAVYYARFEAFAEGRDECQRATAALQLGHLAKIRRNYLEAIFQFDAAKALIHTRTDAEGMIAEAEREIALCLQQITGAVMLWPVR
ncbi:MAG: tetratricopeptide repeat protein [Pseudomonadota bacterium]